MTSSKYSAPVIREIFRQEPEKLLKLLKKKPNKWGYINLGTAYGRWAVKVSDLDLSGGASSPDSLTADFSARLEFISRRKMREIELGKPLEEEEHPIEREVVEDQLDRLRIKNPKAQLIRNLYNPNRNRLTDEFFQRWFKVNRNEMHKIKVGAVVRKPWFKKIYNAITFAWNDINFAEFIEPVNLRFAYDDLELGVSPEKISDFEVLDFILEEDVVFTDYEKGRLTDDSVKKLIALRLFGWGKTYEQILSSVEMWVYRGEEGYNPDLLDRNHPPLTKKYIPN